MKKRDELIPAYAYGRESTDDQPLSEEQQRREVEEYAARHGYRIVRWYYDHGVSGSKGDEERVDYQRLLIDSNSAEARAVLCWSTSRFTRNHPHEAATGKRILKTNGMWLDTVKEGKIDWNSFDGMIKDAIYNIIDHTYSVGLGRDSLRGRRNTFLAGGYPYGCIPYGYNRLYLCGAERREVPRQQRTKNLRGWIQSLIPVPDEAAIVLRIFRLYVEDDKTLCAIARILNGENVPGPGRGVNAVWTVQNVRQRLSCPVYIRQSKLGGQPRNKKLRRHNELEREDREGDWPSLVDRDLFDRAQEKLARGKGQPHEGKSGPLQGILRCGSCGHVLHKENPRRADDPRGNKYRCGSAARGLPVHCHRWTCYEAEIMPRVLRELVAAVDDETIRLLQAAPEQPAKISNREVLEAHLASLEERIGKNADAFADAKGAMRKALELRAEELEAEAEETRQRLAALDVADSQGGLERFLAWWQEIRPQLVWIGQEDAPGCPTLVLRCQEGQSVASVAQVNAPNGKHAEEPGTLADPGKLRGLLKRMKVCVRIYWRQPTEEERAARRKGRGHGCPGRLPEWVLDEARLEVTINCGSSDGRSAWADCHAPCGCAGSRRRASRGP